MENKNLRSIDARRFDVKDRFLVWLALHKSYWSAKTSYSEIWGHTDLSEKSHVLGVFIHACLAGFHHANGCFYRRGCINFRYRY